ncbi:MAG: hypothetical protein NT148_00865, partial [Candidatus Nealsonbacteria bacterium]|nr:hypothetical protein [Candidatus Nealsonbacteria bacterium]
SQSHFFAAPAGTKDKEGYQAQILSAADQYIASSASVVINKWNHLAGSCDTDKCYIYVNGVKGDSIAIPVNYSFNNILAQFEVGTYRGLSRITTGSLDEIKIYGKGMAAAEVQKHYAEGIYRLQLAELTNNSLLK